MRVFDHTADVGLAVWGATPEDLFAWAAAGLARVALGPDGARRLRRAGAGKPAGRAQEPRRLAVNLPPAPDLEALLVAWLNHLIYLLETESLAAGDCRLELRPGPPAVLGGTFAACLVPAGAVRVAVKAATYHGLRVTSAARGEGGYRARVVLDI